MYDDVCFLPASVRNANDSYQDVMWISCRPKGLTEVLSCGAVSWEGSVPGSPCMKVLQDTRDLTKSSRWKWRNLYWVVVSNIFYFHPYLGKIPILTNTFEPKGCWNMVFKRWLSQTPIVITMKIQSVGLLPWLENIWQLATCNFFITQFVKDFIAPCIIFDTTNILIVNSTTTYYQVDYEILNRWIVNREFYCRVLYYLEMD